MWDGCGVDSGQYRSLRFGIYKWPWLKKDGTADNPDTDATWRLPAGKEMRTTIKAFGNAEPFTMDELNRILEVIKGVIDVRIKNIKSIPLYQ